MAAGKKLGRFIGFDIYKCGGIMLMGCEGVEVF
jgi:hypothetical protein